MDIFQQRLIQWVGADIMAAAEEHARAVFPTESCGFVADGEYVACENKHETPLKNFLIDDPRYDAAFINGELTAIIHSHPNGPMFPSAWDMQQQIATNVPWIIIGLNDTVVSTRIGWGGNLPITDVIGRPFVHCVFDCYSLVRDTFRLGKNELAGQGVEWPFDPTDLIEMPRDDAWWVEGADLYMKNFTSAGWREISRSEVQPGDVFLVAIGDRRANPHNQINHAGLLLPKNQILQHLPNRLSRREPAGLWARAADKWIRYEEAQREA